MLLNRDREQQEIYINRSAEHHHLNPLDSNITPVTTNTPSYEWGQSTLTSDQPPTTGVISIVPGFEVPLEEVDQILRQYASEMVPQFPFVPLPTCTAYDLYKAKPLLLKTILWACKPPGPDPAAAFEHWLRQHVAHQSVVLMNKSLEILQALLVFFAWYGFVLSNAPLQLPSLFFISLKLCNALGFLLMGFIWLQE